MNLKLSQFYWTSFFLFSFSYEIQVNQVCYIPCLINWAIPFLHSLIYLITILTRNLDTTNFFIWWVVLEWKRNNHNLLKKPIKLAKLNWKRISWKLFIKQCGCNFHVYILMGDRQNSNHELWIVLNRENPIDWMQEFRQLGL